MTDGVAWAAAEIVVFMVAATLIGFAIGWILGRWLQQRTIGESYELELGNQEELARKAEYRLTEANKTIDKLQVQMRHESEKIGELEAQLTSAQVAAESLVDSDELHRFQEDLEECTAVRRELEARVAELETELTARREMVLAAVVEAEMPIAAEPTKEEGLARISEIAERTAGGLPVADDDLKKVHGIGPKLERTLKDLGITSFRQIANFQAEDIAYVTAALDAFKGRIERDDWMSGAAEQHAKKYNEPA